MWRTYMWRTYMWKNINVEEHVCGQTYMQKNMYAKKIHVCEINCEEHVCEKINMRRRFIRENIYGDKHIC